MLRLRPFRSPDATTIITWTSESEDLIIMNLPQNAIGVLGLRKI